MHPVEVDVVGTESFQTCLERLVHTLAVIAPAVGIVRAAVEGVLGGQDELLPALPHELAEEPLARAVGIKIGRVDEIAASIGEGVEDLFALLLRRTKTPVFTEGHGTETKFGNTQARPAQKFVAHGCFLLSTLSA